MITTIINIIAIKYKKNNVAKLLTYICSNNLLLEQAIINENIIMVKYLIRSDINITRNHFYLSLISNLSTFKLLIRNKKLKQKEIHYYHNIMYKKSDIKYIFNYINDYIIKLI